MTSLLGIAGQKQNGKDILAKIINKSIPDYTVRTVAFADGIKDSFCQLFGVDRNFIEEWKEKPEPPPGWDMTVRKALQFIGDGFRGIKPTVWVDQAARTVALEKWWKKLHIFTDIRYVNELKKTKELGGKVILIYRPGFLNDIDHPSEKQVRAILDWFLSRNIPEGPFSLACQESIDNPPPGVECIDMFLLNDGDLSLLGDKVTKYIVPLLR